MSQVYGELFTYRIFVYEANTGQLIEDQPYHEFPTIYQEMLEHNKNNPDDKWNVMAGIEFPPEFLKFDSEIKEFVQKSISEQVADGLINLSPEQKIHGEHIIPKTKKELVDEGLLTLEINQKVDEDLDQIVFKTEKEMYEEGIISNYDLYQKFLQYLAVKFDESMKPVINYGAIEIHGWNEKRKYAQDWLDLEEKTKDKAYANFSVIYFETSIEESDTDQEVVDKITARASKILEKAQYYEEHYGKALAVREKIQANLKVIFEEAQNSGNRNGIYDNMKIALDAEEWPTAQ